MDRYVPESWLESSWFAILSGPVLILLPIAVIIHALRTGKPTYWITVLLFFPGVGPLAYFFVEVWPNMNFSTRGTGNSLLRLFETRAFRLRTFAENLAESPSLTNLTAYAQELVLQKKFAAAEEVADQWRDQRTLSDDEFLEIYLLIKLKRQNAAEVVARLEASPRQDKTTGLRRLRIQALIQTGQLELAEQLITANRADSDVFLLGLKAELALAKGDHALAVHLLNKLKSKYRSSNRLYRRMEFENYKIGRELLSEIEAAKRKSNVLLSRVFG